MNDWEYYGDRDEPGDLDDELIYYWIECVNGDDPDEPYEDPERAIIHAQGLAMGERVYRVWRATELEWIRGEGQSEAVCIAVASNGIAFYPRAQEEQVIRANPLHSSTEQGQLSTGGGNNGE